MHKDKTLTVIFSKDRPLQLDGTLRSLKRHCSDISDVGVRVIYLASSSRMKSLYRQVMREHPEVVFVREADFRRDLLLILAEGKHVLFLVDDALFLRPFSIRNLADSLDNHPKAIGFSLRLGRNTDYCYALDKPQQIPEFETVADGVLKSVWTVSEHDFAYPLEVSSSLYRSVDILPLLGKLEFRNPNTLESEMAGHAVQFRDSHPELLCATESLAFCAPVNLVQGICKNRVGEIGEYSAESLAQKYADGWRLDVSAYDHFTPAACHEEVELKLVSDGEKVPLVSVVIPCYNQAHFLPEVLRSVRGQTMKDWEVIIVNDGSPDETSAVAKQLIESYPEHSILLIEKSNGGLADARNVGVRVARGAFILPLDADDLIAPRMLEATLGILEGDPDISIVYTDLTHFGVENRKVTAAEFNPIKLRENNQLNCCSLYRCEVWELCGGYNPNMVWGFEDWEFWVACSALGLRAQRLPEALLYYRVKQASMLTKAMEHDRELRARLVLNHPVLFQAVRVADARACLLANPLPLAPCAPKVSVIVPTFNRPLMLQEALNSILAQTFQDFEIVVVNDNGIDIESWVHTIDTDRPIKCIRHPKNKGLAAARNTGLRVAQGKFIAYLDDDDIYLPNHLETLVGYLESTGNDVAYSNAFCALQEKVDGEYVTQQREVQYSSEWDNDRILVENFVPVLCVVHAKRCVDQIGFFDESLSTHEDWEFWLRMSRRFAFHHIRENTAEFRMRNDGTTMTSSLFENFLVTTRMIYRKHRLSGLSNRTLRKKRRHFEYALVKRIAKIRPLGVVECLVYLWRKHC